VRTRAHTHKEFRPEIVYTSSLLQLLLLLLHFVFCEELTNFLFFCVICFFFCIDQKHSHILHVRNFWLTNSTSYLDWRHFSNPSPWEISHAYFQFSITPAIANKNLLLFLPLICARSPCRSGYCWVSAQRTQLHVFPNEFCENRTGDYKVITRKLNKQTRTLVLHGDMATTPFSLTAGHWNKMKHRTFVLSL